MTQHDTPYTLSGALALGGNPSLIHKSLCDKNNIRETDKCGCCLKQQKDGPTGGGLSVCPKGGDAVLRTTGLWILTVAILSKTKPTI